MELTKNNRTHIAILRDNREINLTQEQYQAWRLAKDDRRSTEIITLKNPDTGEIEFDGEIGSVKEFRERKQENLGDYIYYCDFGRKHGIHLIQHGDGCNCKHEFDVIGPLFRHRLKEMGYNISTVKQITEEMRNRYKEKYLK